MEIRNRISRDLHDDIGATLSSINLYGEMAHTVIDHKPGDSKEMLGKISEQAKELILRMGDVIWSMKARDEEKNSISNRLINYSSALLTPKEIHFEMDIDENVCRKISSPVIRKEILLIAKEALNNIAKYSEAKKVNLSFQQVQQTIVLQIQDDGKGFSNGQPLQGNGLGNMKERCRQLNSHFHISSDEGVGVKVTCIFPMAIFNHTG